MRTAAGRGFCAESRAGALDAGAVGGEGALRLCAHRAGAAAVTGLTRVAARVVILVGRALEAGAVDVGLPEVHDADAGAVVGDGCVVVIRVVVVVQRGHVSAPVRRVVRRSHT